MMQIFKQLDVNQDGRLSKNEILAGYKTFMDEKEAE